MTIYCPVKKCIIVFIMLLRVNDVIFFFLRTRRWRRRSISLELTWTSKMTSDRWSQSQRGSQWEIIVHVFSPFRAIFILSLTTLATEQTKKKKKTRKKKEKQQHTSLLAERWEGVEGGGGKERPSKIFNISLRASQFVPGVGQSGTPSLLHQVDA